MMIDLGYVAYRAYRQAPANFEDAPSWAALTEEERAGWRAAADMVKMLVESNPKETT